MAAQNRAMADATKNVDAIFLNMNAIFRALEMTVYGTLGLYGVQAVRGRS